MTVMLTFAAVCSSLVVNCCFYSQFQIYLDSDRKVNMMSLSPVTTLPGHISQNIVSSDLFRRKSQVKEPSRWSTSKSI